MALIYKSFHTTTLKILRFSFLILIISTVLCHSGFAQNNGLRPRVGLALSGGGSSGMAHVGVLKVMEEAGLRPDLITGVSMGSIVGGLYSIGYSADSLSRLFKYANWDYILSNNIPENKVIFSEKHNFRNSIMSLPITPKKVRLPSGLISGQQIESMLSFYAWPAARISDFSKLPIPFLCVASDIKNCKIIDIKKGYLPDAMRASMAVPSIFTPVKIDTSLLVDGGTLRNIAVSELKEMGADIIIGSYTGFHRYKEEELQSVTGILKQIAFLQSFIDYTDEKKKIDIIIEPDVKDYPSTVFSNSDSIIQRGYRAALPYKEYFRKIADSLNLIAPQAKPPYLLDRQTYSFDKIEVTGNIINSDEQIRGILDIKPGERVDKYMLSEKIELLYGKTWFDKVRYRIVPRNDSLILIIDCIEKEKATAFGSVHYDNSLKAGIILNLSMKHVPYQRSFLDFDSFIGQYYRFKVNFTQYLDKNQEVGLSLIADAGNTVIPVTELKSQKGEFLSKTVNGEINVNKMIGLNRMTSISIGAEKFRLNPDFITTNDLKRVTYNSYTISYRYFLNSIDIKYFPNKGTVTTLDLSTSKLISGTIKTAFSEKKYTKRFPEDFQFGRSYRLKAEIKHYFSPGRKVTFSFGGKLLYTYTADTALSPNNLSYLGGFDAVTKRSIAMTGFHSNEIPVEKMASAGFYTDYELIKDLHLEFNADVAAAVEAGNDSNLTYLGGYGLGIGYTSLIGPLRVGFMHGISSSQRYFKEFKGYISIGFCF